jgi:hypothetical protein
MNMQAKEETAAYLLKLKEQRHAAVFLSTSDTLLAVPNPAGNGPRVSALMRRHGEAIGDGEDA